MSRTTLYTIDQEGDAEIFDEFHNAWRGAAFIWTWLMWRYLPNVQDPKAEGLDFGRRHWIINDELFDELEKATLSRRDRIIYETTKDYAIVRAENLLELAEMFESFAEEHGMACSLSEQAQALRKMAATESSVCRGCCWQQTSVSDDLWYVRDEQGEDERRAYNVDRDTKHWFVDFGGGGSGDTFGPNGRVDTRRERVIAAGVEADRVDAFLATVDQAGVDVDQVLTSLARPASSSAVIELDGHTQPERLALSLDDELEMLRLEAKARAELFARRHEVKP